MSDLQLHDRVKAALGSIVVERLGKDLLELDLLDHLEVHDGKVALSLRFAIPAYTSKSELRRRVIEAVAPLPGVREVDVTFARRSPPQRHRVAAQAPRVRVRLPQVAQAVAVFSGKGGVGKSTVSVNLAVALAQAGERVGLFDADVHGPNIPQLMGLGGRPQVADGAILPVERFGVKAMSIGLLVGEEDPLIWRGPMVTKAINELLSGVRWGELDLLLIDLPPGTGDAQLGLAQDLELSGSIAVTTPQEVSLADVRRGITTFKRLEVPLWGIIENMSSFVCPHCGGPSEVFGSGGGEREAQRQGVPLLGRIPLDPAIRAGGDRGVPVVVEAPDSSAAQEFRKIARYLSQKQRQEE